MSSNLWPITLFVLMEWVKLVLPLFLFSVVLDKKLFPTWLKCKCKSIKALMKDNDLYYPVKAEVWWFHTDENWWVWRRHFTPQLWEPGMLQNTANLSLSPCLPSFLCFPQPSLCRTAEENVTSSDLLRRNNAFYLFIFLNMPWPMKSWEKVNSSCKIHSLFIGD